MAKCRAWPPLVMVTQPPLPVPMSGEPGVALAFSPSTVPNVSVDVLPQPGLGLPIAVAVLDPELLLDLELALDAELPDGEEPELMLVCEEVDVIAALPLVLDVEPPTLLEAEVELALLELPPSSPLCWPPHAAATKARHPRKR